MDVIDGARHFTDPDERATIREIGMRAHLSGMHTAAELLGHLEAVGKSGRRQILNDAREAAGLERSEDLDRHEQFRLTQPIAARRSSRRHASGRHSRSAPPRAAVASASNPATGLPPAAADRL